MKTPTWAEIEAAIDEISLEILKREIRALRAEVAARIAVSDAILAETKKILDRTEVKERDNEA